MFESLVRHKYITNFLDYWKTPLLQEMTKNDQVRSCLSVFLSVSAATLAVDLLSSVPINPMLFTGSLLKAVAYTLGMIIAGTFISYFSNRKKPYSGLSVGKTWIVSFSGFTVGYLLLEPYRIYFGHMDLHGSDTAFQLFIKILPVWAVLTYLFVQLQLNRSMQFELTQLEKVNSNLKHNEASLLSEKANLISVNINLPGKLPGRTMDTGFISFVNVIEHYSYIHFWKDDILTKHEIKVPLKDIAAILPQESFVQIHRAYIVNIHHITGLKKAGRSYNLFLKGLDDPIPISRYRVSAVLPKLRPFLDKMGSPKTYKNPTQK